MDRAKINEQRLIRAFSDMVEIDSPSRGERSMADHLKKRYEELDITLHEDDAGDELGGDSGNLYAAVPGTLPGSPILFSAHMDTVEPSRGKRAIVHDDGTITSAGNTVLGSDDAAGLAEILEAVRLLKEHNIPHRSIELLFPVAEEQYCVGSGLLDFDRLDAQEGYFWDLSGDIGRCSLGEPTLLSLDITVMGKAAHAGFSPEEGINAIAAAGLFLSRIKQGRLDMDTVCNIGLIQGGTATNIVSDRVYMRGEIRSMRDERAQEVAGELDSVALEVCKLTDAVFSIDKESMLTAYSIAEDEAVVRRYVAACGRAGIVPDLTRTQGGSDNNSFCRSGRRGICAACGMQDVHTKGEYTRVRDLVSTTRLILELMTAED